MKLKKQVSLFSEGLNEIGFVYGRTRISFSENSQRDKYLRFGGRIPRTRTNFSESKPCTEYSTFRSMPAMTGHRKSL